MNDNDNHNDDNNDENRAETDFESILNQYKKRVASDLKVPTTFYIQNLLYKK
jgi:hypothetical protein